MTVAQPSSSTRSPRLRLALPHAVPMPGFSSPQPPVVVRPSAPLSSRPFKTATLTTFRINTCKSVSKQRTLTPFRINTYKKTGGDPANRRFRITSLLATQATPVVCATRRQYLSCSQQLPHTSRRHGGVPFIIPRSTVPTFKRANSLVSKSLPPLCPLLQAPVPCFQSFAALFAKHPGWGYLRFLQTFRRSDPRLPHLGIGLRHPP